MKSEKLNALLQKLKARNLPLSTIVKAPGRANIIGEHIDYCDGIVLPFAIEQSMYFVGVQTRSDQHKIYAEDYQEQWISGETVTASWMKYFDQILSVLSQKSLSSAGWKVYFTSDIPIGAGVSSSSALCLGFLSLLNKLNQWELDEELLINLASEAEHGVGLRGGKMDQFAIMKGRKNQALVLDCLDHSYKSCAINRDRFHFVLINSGVKHELANSEYNTRRVKVERALNLVQQEFGEEISYRKIEEKYLDYLASAHPVEHRRLRHIYSEMRRVESAIQAIKDGETNLLGNLLTSSHNSLRDDYEVSCSEVDFIVERLSEDPSVYGSRMMGGGFGGSVIALLKKPNLESEKSLREIYQSQFHKNIKVIPVSPNSGLEVLK